MANGLPGYTLERRKEFFETDWPICKTAIDLFIRNLPMDVDPPPHLTKELIWKMTKIITIFSDIIADDQAEIAAIKVINKAMEKDNGS